ncbi:MAG: response regulator [Gammaproteobacteria bacterium]|nr:response regulator [Gammaproteobacteria bacterium]
MLQGSGDKGLGIHLRETGKKALVLAGALEDISEGVAITDPDLRITHVNRAFTVFTGYAAEAVPGRDLLAMQGGDNRQEIEFYAQIRDVLYETGGWKGELPGKRINDKDYFLSLSLREIKDEKQEIAGYVAVFTDIGEQRRRTRERALERDAAACAKAIEADNQAKTDFLANMSHEFRTPLNGILGFAQLLQRDGVLNPEQKKSVSMIQQSGEHLMALINDIADLVKLETGKIELHKTSFAFPAFLENITETITKRAKQKCLEFVYVPPSSLPSAVEGDENRLRQVLINLLGNSVKFTDQGKVTFTVERRENRLVFQIEDTGSGLSDAQLKAIFQPFPQAGGRRVLFQGAGLGLPLSKRLVDMMEGSLEVTSPPGQGSLFRIDVPLPEVSEQQTSVPEKRITGFKGATHRILVVDDEMLNRSILVTLLSRLGFEVCEAENGEVCIERALATQPELILMDLMMPVMDGIETTCKIRQSPELKDVKIIIASGVAVEKRREESLQAGCDDFIPKPIEIDGLLEKLQTHLDLEWTYTLETGNKQKKENLAEQTFIRPPPDIAEALYELSLMGDVNGIAEQLDELEQMDGKYSLFTSQMRHFVDALQVRRLREVIKSYISEENST